MVGTLSLRRYGDMSRRCVTVVALTVLFFASMAALYQRSAATGPSVSVIVRAVPGQAGATEAAVSRLGGKVVRELGIIGGFSADVPVTAVARLSVLPGVTQVVPDARVKMSAESWRADRDNGSLTNLNKALHTSDLWDKSTGTGIGVALIDTGVTPVKGLDNGNVVNGPDLSLDAGSPNQRFLDEFGHGTHMAGIIAGHDAGLRDRSKYKDPHNFVGVAPDATLVNVKVGSADGSVDVSQVIAALDWVVAHRNDPGLNIRVVNLSFGTDSTQDYRIDPLAYAAEVAWRNGIVVVAAAGNEGNSTSLLTSPASDPFVLAVGADGAYDKDGKKLYVTSFSNQGSPGRTPDLLAPGKSIVGLRVPGSLIDTLHPEGRVGDDDGRFFRGSGTSQSTAIVSGTAALILQAHPELTPDQVKGLLMGNASPLRDVDRSLQGAGALNADHLRDLKDKDVPAYTQPWQQSDGSGSLDAARGSAHISLDGKTPLAGENTVFGVAFDGHSWSNNAWDAASWAGGSWSGTSWTGDAWSGHSWSGSRWSGSRWSGHSWSDDAWDGHSWSGHSWSNDSWLDETWDGHSWSGGSWG